VPAVARGRLQGSGLVDVAVIFRQTPKVSGGIHFGSRLAFRADRTLFITTGDRGQGSPAQDLGSHIGKVLRIGRDGSTPADNPVFGAGAQPQLWSIGHRNAQGAAVHPVSGELWLSEHGPQGGDELNRVLPGRNYGWPLRSYGCNYGDPIGDACRIAGGVHAPAYEEPASIWVPTSTAPSAMCFYTGDRLPAWRGHLFIGALAGSTLWRIVLDGSRVVEREEVAVVKALGERIRCVQPSREGWLHLLTDSGKLLRLEAG
jgi:aldose sugar dehydrogenase